MNDKFNLLKKANTLINEHLNFDKLKVIKHDTEVAIIQGYNQVEKEFLTYIEKTVRDIDSISNLTNSFYYSCSGFKKLGRSMDNLMESLVDTKQTCSILGRDANLYHGQWGFDTLDLDYQTPSDVDKRALAAMVVLDLFTTGSYQALSAEAALGDLVHISCIAPLLDSKWEKRPLIGYFGEDYRYRIKETNNKFVTIFSTALKRLINKDTSLEVLQIKDILHGQLLSAWTDCTVVNPFVLYVELERLIGQSSMGVNIDTVNELIFGSFAVTKDYNSDGVAYKLNYRGLECLADTLKNLELDVLQTAEKFISLIDGLKHVS